MESTNETVITENTMPWRRNLGYKLFWVYMICGIMGFVIETIWCWIDFQEFTSRTSNLFFPISSVWGLGGIVLLLTTLHNRWNNRAYIFVKCMITGTIFEFLCGYLGEKILEVTFWDYSGMPLHIGKYINIPFCIAWGLIGVLWLGKVYPVLEQKIEKMLAVVQRSTLYLFLIFIITSQIFTGMALLRMHERKVGLEAENRIEKMMDRYFPDRILQNFFPKMKSTVTGEKIYTRS